MQRNAIERPGVTPTPASAAWVHELLAWYRANARDLPWRRHATPYAVWVSEIMLQQTRVDTVVPYYRRFMRAFPSIRKLARAEQQSVLKLWEGLGYYARARNLQRAAQVLTDAHHGRMPRTPGGLRALPGIGDYTAAAIASICFGQPDPVVDGNVLRVFCRVWRMHDDIRRPATKRRLTKALAEVIPPDAPGNFNQAVMELGALVCRPTSPRCTACPLRPFCGALAAGEVDRLPLKSRRAAVPEHHIAIGIVERRGRILIARRRSDAMLGGLWEFPGGKCEPGEAPRDTVAREVLEETGLHVEVGSHLCTVRHTYSHFRIVLDAFLCGKARGRARAIGGAEVRWVTPDELDRFPFPTANKKILSAYGRVRDGHKS